MKKLFAYILTAALLTAALVVPASAASVDSGSSNTGNSGVADEEWMKDIWLYIYVNNDIIQPVKRILLNNYTVVSDGELTMLEILSVVDDYYAATDTENGYVFKGAYMETTNITALDFVAGRDETPITDLDAARMDGTVVIKARVTGVTNLPEEAPETPAVPAVYMNVSDAWGAPGDTVTVTLEIGDAEASSVGVKYSLPEGIEFVSGQWLLADGILDSVTDFGAAYAWSEAQAIDGAALELTLQIREGAQIESSIPFEVVLKDVDTTVCTGTLSSSVHVEYYINSFGIDCSGVNMNVGGVRTIGVQVDPEFLADQVVWTSSDLSVAEVSGGVVTGVGPGTATITARLGDWSQECTVQVFESTDSGTKACLITGEPGCVRHIRCILNSLLG